MNSDQYVRNKNNVSCAYQSVTSSVCKDITIADLLANQVESCEESSYSFTWNFSWTHFVLLNKVIYSCSCCRGWAISKTDSLLKSFYSNYYLKLPPPKMTPFSGSLAMQLALYRSRMLECCCNGQKIILLLVYQFARPMALDWELAKVHFAFAFAFYSSPVKMLK